MRSWGRNICTIEALSFARPIIKLYVFLLKTSSIKEWAPEVKQILAPPKIKGCAYDLVHIQNKGSVLENDKKGSHHVLDFLYGTTERIDKRLAKSQDLSWKYSFMSRNIYCSYLHIYIVRTLSLGVWFIFIQKMIYHST